MLRVGKSFTSSSALQRWKGPRSHHHSYNQHPFAYSSSQQFIRPLVVLGTSVAAMTLQQQYSSSSTSVADCAAALQTPREIPLPKIDLQAIRAEIAKEEVAAQSLWQSFVKKSKEAYDKFTQAMGYVERVLTYMVFSAPLLGLMPANYLLGEKVPELENMTWGYLVWAVQKLGPCFVKLAQWASTRPDIFPPRLIEHIVVLQDDVKITYPFSMVESTLKSSFGDDWKSKLVVDPTPLGAGSVAQVFKGILKKGKEEVDVAIKLIHPHVEKIIKTDMEILNMFVGWIDKFPSLEILSLGDTVRQFSECMNAQMDLRKEASHLVKFGKKFANDEWAVFPQPIDGFVTKHVMLETLMPGTPINSFMSLPDATSLKLKRKLSDLGARLILKMVFFDNFIHGDLHPGNVLVQFNSKGEPRLVVLDCGIVYSSRSDAEHEKLVDICLAFMQHDGVRAGQLMIDHANNKPNAQQVKHEAEFCTSIQKIVTDCEKENYFEHMGEYLARICELARVHMVKFDPGYFKIAMALKVAEGIALALDKELDLISKCIPIVVKARALRKLGIQKFPEPEPDDDFITPESK